MIRSILLLIAAVLPVLSQAPANWTNPFPPHTITGNLHYVGTEDLACFLITTPEGHILINTGLADSVSLIRDGARKLGFKLEDVRILLTMQAHFDHVAGFAEIQKLTGAKVFATERDAPVLEDGGKSDPLFARNRNMGFAPVKVERRLKDGDTVRLGGTELKVHLTPGHTRGSVSYSMNNGKVLIANMNTVVMPLVGNAGYPDIVDDYEQTIRKQKAMHPEIWVAAHGSHYGLAEKHKKGSFVDPDGYQKAVAHYERTFRERLAKERRASN